MNIIVTGASQGLGYEIVKEFCSTHKEVKILALARNAEKLNQLKVECKQEFNVNISILSIDFSDSSFIDVLDQSLPKDFTKVDILINNSASLINSTIENMNYKEAEYLYKVNALGPYFLIKSLFSKLKASKIAHVVNISSMGGFQGSSKFPGLSIYSSTKAALSNLTECLAEEFKETNIKVNALALGSVNTEMLRKAFPDFRSPNSPKSIAMFITDFAVNGSKVFNGKILPVSNSTP